MAERAEDRPEYTWLRQFKRAHGGELLQRYGAHAMGIGWKQVGGEKTDQLALIFYVERKLPDDELEAEPIPSSFTFTPPGSEAPVQLKTDVVQTPPAEFESE